MNNINREPQSYERIVHILSTLSKYRRLWITPMVLGVILSAAYVLVLRQETWSAKQALIVRDDLLGQSFKPGRFDSIESMKSAQETILEIARKPQVIRNALEKLGPASKGLFGMGLRGWPSEETIEDVQGSITFSAPNGAEFGKTEVIVLNTKATTRERSRQFIELLLNEIILKVDEVRSLRLQSMEVELLQARNAALMDLEDSKARLREMDQKLGVDVGAMSAINDAQSSDNTIKRDISQIRLEKRQVETKLESLNRSLAMLAMAKENPNQIVNISGDLGKSQPALDALKKELVKTQKNLAIMNSIRAMQQQIYLELDSSMFGLQNEIAVAEKKLERLNYEMENLDGRLLSLSSKRADSLTLIADLRTRTEIANKAQADLSEIQGLSLARNADLLTRVDEPQVSTRPDGLGKKASILAGGFGGLMLGLGLVMLVAPPIGSDEDVSLNGSGGSLDRFFDSSTFENVVANASSSAAAAATAAVQSAFKAKEYFMSSRMDREETTTEDSQAKPVSDDRETAEAMSTDLSVPVQITEVDTPAEPSNSPELTVTDNDSQTRPSDVPASLEPARGIKIQPAKTTESQPDEPFSDESSFDDPAPVASAPDELSIDETSFVEPATVEISDAIAIENVTASQLAALNLKEMKSKTSQEQTIEPAVLEDVTVEPSEFATPVSAADQEFDVAIEETSSTTSQLEWETVDPVAADQVVIDQEPAETQELDPPAVDHEETLPEIVVTPVDEKAASSEDEDETTTAVVTNESESDVDQPIRRRAEAETIQIDSMAELMRRDPNVRPVDLAKSVETKAAFIRIVPKKKLGNGEQLDSRSSDQVQEKTGSGQAAEGLPDGAVPEQIEKLNESISRFTKKPPKERPSNES